MNQPNQIQEGATMNQLPIQNELEDCIVAARFEARATVNHEIRKWPYTAIERTTINTAIDAIDRAAREAAAARATFMAQNGISDWDFIYESAKAAAMLAYATAWVVAHPHSGNVAFLKKAQVLVMESIVA